MSTLFNPFSYLCAAFRDVNSKEIDPKVRRTVVFTARNRRGIELRMTNSKPFTGGQFFFRSISLPQGTWTIRLQSPATNKEIRDGVDPPLEYSMTLQVGPPIEEPYEEAEDAASEIDDDGGAKQEKDEEADLSSRKRRMVSCC